MQAQQQDRSAAAGPRGADHPDRQAGCHLCDDAREVIARVAQDLRVGWQELSIADDPTLSAAYWEQIPVTLVDGEQHDYWRVDEARLRAALA